RPGEAPPGTRPPRLASSRRWNVLRARTHAPHQVRSVPQSASVRRRPRGAAQQLPTPHLQQRHQVRRRPEWIRERAATIERKRGHDNACNLRQNVVSLAERETLERGEPLERIVVLHAAKPQHYRLCRG